jgi:hypothetical protein
MSAPTFTVTEPCVIPDLPEEQYHADPVPGGSLSSGGARTLLEPGGPAKFDYGRNHPRASTKAFDLGHAAHTMALGVGAGLVVVDARDWKTKAAQEAKAEAYALGGVPVLSADFQRVAAMVDAIKAHPIAGALILAEGDAEQSLFWIDQDTGVWCRARHDKAIRDRSGRLRHRRRQDLRERRRGQRRRSSSRQLRLLPAGRLVLRRRGRARPRRRPRLRLRLRREVSRRTWSTSCSTSPPRPSTPAGRRNAPRPADLRRMHAGPATWPGYPTDTITDIALPAWATREDLP